MGEGEGGGERYALCPMLFAEVSWRFYAVHKRIERVD